MSPICLFYPRVKRSLRIIWDELVSHPWGVTRLLHGETMSVVSWYLHSLYKILTFTHIHIGIGSISTVQIQHWLQIVTKVNHS